MTSRRHALVAGALALATCLSGCSLLEGDPNAAPEPKITIKQTPPAGSEALARFYSQKLTWALCGKAQCTHLTVPVDYAKPDGATISLAVLRMRATRPDERIGSLVVNPGGPGASGVDYARAAHSGQVVSKAVWQHYDVVGFDPRGVMRSAPVDCLPDAQLDTFIGGDPTPDDAGEQQALLSAGAALGRGCLATTGDLAAHVSTVEAAKDMDVLRSALGDAKLNYLGKSYGTLLGATYADLFPTLVGRFVLDGVVPPDATPEELSLGQAEGFERATRAWAAACVRDGSCPLGSSVDAVMAGLRDFLKGLDAQPLPVRGDARVTRLTEGWAANGVAQAMYDQGRWDFLTDALRKAQRGDGTELMLLGDDYAQRNPQGRYLTNIMEAYYAITCLDNPDSSDPATYVQRTQEFSAQAPTWGAYMSWGNAVCGQWPVHSTAKPHRVSAPGSGPIVVVGTTRDPATPYESSVRLRDELSNARLITFDGDGHTAYTRSNSCVDKPIDAYYVSGTVPADNLRC